MYTIYIIYTYIRIYVIYIYISAWFIICYTVSIAIIIYLRPAIICCHACMYIQYNFIIIIIIKVYRVQSILGPSIVYNYIISHVNWPLCNRMVHLME